MAKKINNKVMLAIELILIIAGLVLASIGAIKSLSNEMPGSVVPEETEGVDGAPAPQLTGAENPQQTDGAPAPQLTGAENPQQAIATNPNATENGGQNPAETTGAVEPNTTVAEGEVPPAEEGAPVDGVNMSIGKGDALSFVIVYVVPVLVYILLLVYVLIEYRKPHGNLLRTIMLIYALMLAIWSVAQGENVGCAYILPCTAVIIAYLSGRLNKIKKNIVWIAIAAAFLIGYGILQTVMLGGDMFGVLQFSHCYGVLLQWIALVLAYFSRYEEHIAAGKKEVPAV